MKLNSVVYKQNRLSAIVKFTLSPAMLSGVAAATLPLMSGAQARDARANYSPPVVSRPVAPSPSFSRPAFAPSSPSFAPSPSSSPSLGGGTSGSLFGSGMRTTPTVTQRPIITTSPGVGDSLNSRTGISTPLYFQTNQNGGTTRTQMPGDGTVRTQAPGTGTTRTQVPGTGTTRTQAPNGVITSTGTQQSGQTIFQMPTRITRTNPGTINGIIGNPAGSYNRFNNSAEARRFRFGVPNHGRYYYGNYGGFNYFPGDLAFYSGYSPYYSFGYTALSPYAFYYGAFPPFITLGSVYSSPPQYVYVPYPVYRMARTTAIAARMLMATI